jgi:tetratricopeptide (TPR) repeat protein
MIKMKNYIYIAALLITTSILAQTTSNLELQQQKIKLALSYNDKAAAADAMYNIIAMEGDKSTYKDSLAYLYFNDAKYVSSFLVTNDILKTKPENIELLEINAISVENMGALDKAVEVYTDLLSKTKNNYHAYKLASLQVAINKPLEAYKSIKKADLLEDTGKIKVNFQVNKNYSQNVDLKPAIAYLEGIILLNLKKETEAKLSFMRAVNLFPDFVLAKSKLTTLENSENLEKKED